MFLRTLSDTESVPLHSERDKERSMCAIIRIDEQENESCAKNERESALVRGIRHHIKCILCVS